MVAVGCWIALSYLLRFYFRHFANFNKTYGKRRQDCREARTSTDHKDRFCGRNLRSAEQLGLLGHLAKRGLWESFLAGARCIANCEDRSISTFTAGAEGVPLDHEKCERFDVRGQSRILHCFRRSARGMQLRI